MIVKNNALSFAVFAFAVGDMNALESVMTTARPCAFLSPSINYNRRNQNVTNENVILISIKISKLYQHYLLVP